ncbi:hypothetical protein Scep_025899 [Stephania cephalantha]|uniref:Uncharacterized protein n=1 Tax=Stephania cephalantha TaxID=152367 RepID=A0AAP0ELM1_9MAGN
MLYPLPMNLQQVVELRLPSLLNIFYPRAASANLPSSNWVHLLFVLVTLFHCIIKILYELDMVLTLGS